MAAKKQASAQMTPAEKAAAEKAAAEKAKKKADNFKRLATKRMQKALTAMSGVAALSNTNSYSYDQGQVQKIIQAIDAARNSVVESFTKPQAGKAAGFTL